MSDGNHLTIAENYSDEGVRYLRGQDISGDFLVDSNAVYIPKSEYAKLSRSHIFKNDVLVTIVGANTGQTAIVTNPPEMLTANCKLGIARPNIQKISPFYLHVFLASKYGQSQILRNIRGGGQSGLILPDLRATRIARFSKKFENTIHDISEHLYLLRDKTSVLYSEAENILLHEMKIRNMSYATKDIVSSVKTLKTSFLRSGRIDAEYYHPKYDEIESKIKSYKGGFANLGETIKYIFTGEYSDEYHTAASNLKFYIRSLNIDKGQIEIDENYYVDPSKFQKKVNKGDIITARVGTLGIFGEIDNDSADAICSDNVLCFRLPDSFYPDVYTLYFNSKLNFELIDRLARGSVQQRLNQETLKEIIIPIFGDDVQQKISKKVKESYASKRLSRELLELAKNAVEIAIEESEEKAIQFINNKIETLA